MKSLSLKALLVTIGFCFTVFANAQNGTITGIVIDGDNDGKAMYKVRVKALNTLSSAWTDSTGLFVLKDLPSGTYSVDLKIFKPSYRKKVVTDVVVVAGQDTKIDVTFGAEVVKLSEKAPPKLSLNKFVNKNSEGAQLEEKQNSTKVVDGASKTEITKKGDPNVGAAVKRVAGVSLENGKYANIRGLNDRYTKTLLNGAEIPGLDANRNAVQLDMFPTAFLQSLDVVKTFSPDLPGDFTGGLIDIKTAEAPDSLTITLSTGISYNPQVNSNTNFLNYEGSERDWLGYDNGSRDLKSNVLDAVTNETYLNPLADITVLDQNTQAEQDAKNAEVATYRNQNKAFQDGVKGLGTKSVPLNHKINFTIGNTKVWDKRDSVTKKRTIRELGYFAGVNYSRSYSFFDSDLGERSVYEALGQEDLISKRREFDWSKSQDEVLLGYIAGLDFKINTYHKVGLNFMRNQSGVKSTTYTLDKVNTGDDQFKRVHLLNYFERNLNSAQLHGNHKFRLKVDSNKLKDIITSPIEVSWLSNYTISKQDQPDLRNLVDAIKPITEDSSPFVFDESTGIVPSRFWRFMNEKNRDNKIHITIPVTIASVEHKFKIGASHTVKERDYVEHGFNIDGLTSHSGDWNDFFSAENVGFTQNQIDKRTRFGQITGTEYVHNNRFTYANQGKDNNNYHAEQSVLGLYAMTEAHLLRDNKKNNKLDFVGGVRYEKTNINVITEDSTKGDGNLVTNDLLPSVNFIYTIWNKKKVAEKRDSTKINRRTMKLRLSYNKTLARPTFREISPFNSDDFILNAKIIGNPDLNRSLVHNYDFRWEYYPRTGELFSVSMFYKKILDPIAQIQNAKASNLEYTWKNLENATIIGTELEARKKLGFISPRLKNFDIGVNVTLSKSVSKLDTANLSIIRTIDKDRPATQPLIGQSPYLLNVALGYDSKQNGWSANVVYNVFGKRVALYNSDGTPDIYELPVPVLDFSIKKQFSERFSIGFRAKNLINPLIKQAYVFQKGVGAYDKYSEDEQEYIFKLSQKGRSYSLSASYKF